jgi:capsular exopolysaccharide synthesis family protein
VANTSLEHDTKQGQLVIASPQSISDVKQISTILRRRRAMILSVSCVVMSVAGLLALMTKPTYQSYMQILVTSHRHADTPSKNGSKNTDSVSSHPDVEAIDYTTQMKLMLSSMLIQKAVDLLHDTYPDLTVEDIEGKKGKPKPLIVNKVEEKSKGNQTFSQLLEVSYKTNDPIKAQQVLQALEQVYQDYNAKQQKERLVKGLSFFNERLPKVKNEVIQAEKNLEQFRQKNNLFNPEAQGQILLESLADTQKQLRITRAQLQDAKARYNSLQQQLASSTQKAVATNRLNQSTHYQTLLDEIHNTELALARERQRYTEDSPVVKELLQQRQTQLKLLREEVKQALGSTSTQQTPEDASTLPAALTKKNTHVDESLKLVQLPIKEASTVQPALSKRVSSDATSVDNQTMQVSSVTGGTLITQNQTAGVDQKLKQDLIAAQTTAMGLSANEKSLAESEQQIRSQLDRYQNLMAQYKRLLPEVEMSRKTLEELIAAQRSMGQKIAEAGVDWQVLEEPQRGVYLGSNRLWFLLGGIVLGPILGVATALNREWSSDAVYTPQTLQKLTNFQLLGIVPKLPQRRKKQKAFKLPLSRRQTQGESPNLLPEDRSSLDIYSFLPSHETLDITYQNIQIKGFPLTYKSLMLTSSVSGEGKSTLALGLAVSAAHMHQRVLVVDANLRKPSLHKMLELSNDWGLSLLLIDEINSNIKEYVQPIHPTIDVLTAGPIPEDPVQLLSSKRMEELLKLFEQTYDLVIIDAPSIIGTVDAKLIACICDGIVIVSRIGQVTQTELTQATEIFSKSQLNVIGMIANAPNNF